MGDPAPAKHENLAIMPHRKIKVNCGTSDVLHLPGGQRILVYSLSNGSFRVLDLERGTQFGEEWEDKERAVIAIASSPDGKKVATGSFDGAVKLWNVDTGKVMKKWTGHAKQVQSVCWSSDGRRVVSGSLDETFRVWDVESGDTILGPINGGRYMWAVCYSPDGKMIATAGGVVKIWDANTGELLKTLEYLVVCLAWTLDGKTLIAGEYTSIMIFDTATWTVLNFVPANADTILLSPNGRILASAKYGYTTAQLLNLETSQPIGTPLHHEDPLNSATFSADGKFLVTSCSESDDHIYTWDVSAIVKEAGLLSGNVVSSGADLRSSQGAVNKPVFNPDTDATLRRPREAPKIAEAPGRQIPPGFFDNVPRPVHSSTPHSQHTLLGRLPTFLSRRRSRPRAATEHDTQPRSRPLIWTRNLVFGMLRRQDQLRESPIVDVPYTAGKPRNYHARKKTTASSSRPSNTYAVPTGTSQGTTSSQQPLATATSSGGPPTAVAAAVATGTLSHPDIIITQAEYWTRFLLWIGCISFQHADG